MLNKYLIGLLGIVCVTIGLLWWRLDDIAAERDKWRETATTNAATIAALQAEAERTEAILSDLRENRARIEENHRETLQRLSDLEQSNEQVRDWLRQPMPDSVVGLLYGEDGDDPPDPAERDDAVVQGDASPKTSTGRGG